MRVNDDYPNVNAARQIPDTESVLSYWKRCLKFRREHKDVFIYGGFQILDPEDKDVVAFRRYAEHESFVTVTNFTGKHLEYKGLEEVDVDEWVIGNYELDTHNKRLGKVISLRPWEGAIGRCRAVDRTTAI
jgi:oligo-1,6-glucosidase